MKKIMLSVFISLSIISCQLSVKKAQGKTLAAVLLEKLKAVKGKGTLFGHQDDLAYGIGWKYVEGESDTKRITGDYPALFGWELGGLELGHEVNLDSVPFNKMREYVIWVHQHGGINTFSWHPFSPVDETKKAWVTDEVVVKHILPGGANHEDFKRHLDKVAVFFSSLKTPEGEPLSFIFRPWHEMDGSWFWWGSKLCSPNEYKILFRFTIDYLHMKGLNNFLTAYSPDCNFTSENEYLTWYPGDDIVDIIGVDNYWDMRQEEGGLEDAIMKLEIAVSYAEKTNKIAAFTETGSEKVEDPEWFTKKLGAALNASDLTRKIVYTMVWRNNGLTHFYVPYTGHPAVKDFKDFVNQDSIWLLNDWVKFNEPSMKRSSQ